MTELVAVNEGTLADEAGDQVNSQITLLFMLSYGRNPTDQETEQCEVFVNEFGLPALCRVVFNTSELIYVR